MIPVASCVICDGAIVKVKQALVAPFLAERIWKRKPFCVELVRCTGCGFLFYNPRLDDEELQRLYEAYRREEYLRQRHSSEPWYTEKFNADLASAPFYAMRRERLRALLGRVLAGRRIERVLDYGGDHGDLVAGLLEGAKAFVYDISGVCPAEGVASVPVPGAAMADLILSSNVLEHVGFPKVLVQEIARSAPKDGLILLEVPCEEPLGTPRIVRRVAQVAIMSLFHPKLTRHVMRPASLYMMHEHINYFTEHSLEQLMRSCGISVMASGAYAFSSRAGKADMAWSLGMKG